jgi:hypothetical protein
MYFRTSMYESTHIYNVVTYDREFFFLRVEVTPLETPYPSSNDQSCINFSHFCAVPHHFIIFDKITK